MARRVVATTAIEEEKMATETKLEGLEQELSTLLDVGDVSTRRRTFAPRP